MWYQAGLAFDCHQCGNCCSGPEEGYVWVTLKNIAAMAAYMKLSQEVFTEKYVRRVGRRYSLIEKKPSNDCIFLSRQGKKISCEIYPVRPKQCRTWPFWPENLHHPDSWNHAGQSCAGINRGKLYSMEAIDAIRNGQMETGQTAATSMDRALQWISTNLKNSDCLNAVADIYRQLEGTLVTAGGLCRQSGRCCRFQEYGHRLYVTTLEMLFFMAAAPKNFRQKVNDDPSLLDGTVCPFQMEKLCTVRDIRPAGCRIYFCDGIAQAKQNDLTEKILKQLRELHEQQAVPYYYGEWTDWLKQFYAR